MVKKQSIAVFGLLLAAIPAGGQTAPAVELSNGILHAKIYLPDSEKGYYRGTRFDWSGVIASLEYNGHSYFGPFFQKFDASVPDVIIGDTIVAGANSAASGPVEEFIGADETALGYREAKPREAFCKIGVGVLQKPEESSYSSYQHYTLLSPGMRTVRKGSDWIEFVQELDCGTGYAYSYRKKIQFIKNKPAMVLEHSLRNTGSKLIDTEVYDHNFLSIDQHPSGPDFAITFPFDLKATSNMDGLAEIRGKQISFLRVLAHDDTLYTLLKGFSDSQKDYKVTVENRKTGAGVVITGDRPLSQLGFWAVRTVLAPEPFIRMRIAAGEEFNWKYTYDFYTTTARAAGR
ncbi:MAG TPA: hypothetical protein VKV39_02610 [Candidatus Sulfotelmatobacter sp.]|nr:hypothetical protein [Candidatus Sulfotelmatobacter sp.]